MTTSDFPVLDGPRLYANNMLSRCVIDTLGDIEPYIGETDSWVSMPLRLVYDQAAGWHLECGPYDLDRADIERLRAAIARYDELDDLEGKTENHS